MGENVIYENVDILKERWKRQEDKKCKQNHGLLIQREILNFPAVASIGMSCLLTNAYKASLIPIHSKVERQISKDFISDIKSSVSNDL